MKNKKHTKIKYFDVWGLRKEKYKFLETYDIKNTKWQKLELKEPHYFFVPKDTKGEEVYQKFISITDIFEKYVSGVKTHRDEFMIGFNKKDQENKIRQFVNDLPDDIIQSGLSIKPTKYWDISQKRKYLRNNINDNKFIDYLYRPFDKRIIYYDPELIERGDHRFPVMQNMLGNNLAMITTRRIAGQNNFQHAFISNLVSDLHSISDQSYVFPLYLYNDENKEQQSIFDNKDIEQANFNQGLVGLLEKSYNEKFALNENITGMLYAVDIFYYIYGILYSSIYRKKYNEFLKIDFPKIPFIKDYKLFLKISDLGKELGSLHLLLGKPKTKAKFSIMGESRVEKRKYNEKEKRVYINEAQYFENIEPDVWNYYIGGYQVLDKWLKDRTGRILEGENNDVDHYLEIIGAIEETIELQKEIDKIYPQIEKNLIKI